MSGSDNSAEVAVSLQTSPRICSSKEHVQRLTRTMVLVLGSLFLVGLLPSVRSLPISTTTPKITSPHVITTVRPFWTKTSYPNPMKEPSLCGRTKPSYLCDPNQLLKPDGNAIDPMLAKIQTSSCLCRTTPCKGNLLLAVAVVPKIAALPQKTKEEKIEEFGDYLTVNNWKFGPMKDRCVMVISVVEKMVSMVCGPSRHINTKDFETLQKLATFPGIADSSNAVAYGVQKMVATIGNSCGVTFASIVGGGGGGGGVGVGGGSLGTWNVVMAVAVVVGFIILLSLAGYSGHLCGTRCGKEEREESRRKRQQGERRESIFVRMKRNHRERRQNRKPRDTRGKNIDREYSDRERERPREEREDRRPRKPWKQRFGRYFNRGRRVREDVRHSGEREGPYHVYHDVPPPIEEERRSDHIDDRRSDRNDDYRSSDRYSDRRSDRSSRREEGGYF